MTDKKDKKNKDKPEKLQNLSKSFSKGQCGDPCKSMSFIPRATPDRKKTIIARMFSQRGEVQTDFTTAEIGLHYKGDPTKKEEDVQKDYDFIEKPHPGFPVKATAHMFMCRFVFYKEAIKINNKTPDCTLAIIMLGRTHAEDKRKDKDKKKVTNHRMAYFILIPFKTGEKITEGTEKLSEIIEKFNSTPREYTKTNGVASSDPVEFEDIDPSVFIPPYVYYYTTHKQHSSEVYPARYLVFSEFQAIKEDDLNTVNRIFKVSPSQYEEIQNTELTNKEKDRGLPIYEFVTSDTSIKDFDYSDAATTSSTPKASSTKRTSWKMGGIRGKSREGFIGSNIREGLEGMDDVVYLDCAPVGKDEKSVMVTEKYDKPSLVGPSVSLQILIMIVVVVFGICILYGINFAITKYISMKAN
tara:strand:+ start:358 stop:1593 length:1236 start_codon:yes stop_codon:yes gene_type:complete